MAGGISRHSHTGASMPLNSPMYSFNNTQPKGGFAQNVGITESLTIYNGLTTAQLTAISILTQVAVTSAGVLLEGAKQRKAGIYVIIPTNQVQVTIGNVASGTVGGIVAPPLPPLTPGTQTVINPSNVGFTLPSGQAALLQNYNGPVYAATPVGSSSIAFILDV